MHTCTPPAASHSQTVAAGGQEPAGGGCIDLFPAVGAAPNTHTHAHQIPKLEAVAVYVSGLKVQLGVTP